MKYDSCIRAAVRLQLALVHEEEFPMRSLAEYEDCVDLVVALLEDANDGLKPSLEEKARNR